MDANDARFAAFVIFSLAAALLGYIARERRWLDESVARPIHFHTVAWTWSTAAVLALWSIPVAWETLWVVLLQAMVTVLPALGVIPVARRMGATRGQIGVMAIAVGVCNIGYTLGGYLCYALIGPDHDASLGVVGVCVSVLAVCIILFLYPIALHFGELDTGQTITQLSRASLTGPPALPLYGAIVGATLAIARVPQPDFLADYYLKDIVLFALTFGSHLGIGLRLRFKFLPGDWEFQGVLAVFVFGLTPALTFGFIALTNLTPFPMSDLAARVMRVEAFMPAGVSCVMLANIFHLDTRLAASLWLWNTLAFLVLLLPVLIVVLS